MDGNASVLDTAIPQRRKTHPRATAQGEAQLVSVAQSTPVMDVLLTEINNVRFQ